MQSQAAPEEARNLLLTHMRTRLDLDENLLEEARLLTGISGKAALLHRGLRELIQRESARRLAAKGGTAPSIEAIPRRRPITLRRSRAKKTPRTRR